MKGLLQRICNPFRRRRARTTRKKALSLQRGGYARVYSFAEFAILYPLCTDEERARLNAIMQGAERPETLAGHPVPKDLNLVSYGMLDDLAQAAKGGAAAMIECICRVTGATPEELQACNVIDVYGAANWLGREVERINKLFKSIAPKYTAEELQAGVKLLDFGSFGVLDWYAHRQGIADQNAVRDVAWVRIYTCMKQDGQKADYEKRLNKVYQNKYKHNGKL